MSSTEPPSRVPPRQQPHETKSAREELSSKGKVEKVREIDPDEQTRKKKFMQYYKGIDEEDSEQDSRPSPFDLYSGKNLGDTESSSGKSLSDTASSSSDSFGDVENAIVPAPSYAPPPDIYAQGASDEEEDAVTEGALPQSEDFWGDFGLPDQPPSQTEFKASIETAQLPKDRTTPHTPAEKKAAPLSEHRKKVKEVEKKEEEVHLLTGKFEAKKETHTQLEKRKKEEGSILGPPGKPAHAKSEKRQTSHLGKTPNEPTPQKSERKAAEKFEQPLWTASNQEPRRHTPTQKGPSKEAQKLPSPMEQLSTPPSPSQPFVSKKQIAKKAEEEPGAIQQNIDALPVTPQARGEEGGKHEKRRDEKILEIESPSLPALPKDVQPMALSATTQASPYLTPQTASLFFQMVGTIFVMANSSQGISRTEIVLNNPSFANSKFFGATITIEKYATAPDSFNIRLSGSQEAVVSFRENIPSLLTAFENGKFNFRIGRIDVEYTTEKPVFRRKEKGEDKGESGGDLGERRNK